MKKLFVGAMTVFMLGCAACTTTEIDPAIDTSTVTHSETEPQIDIYSWLGLYSYEKGGYKYYIHVHDYYEEIGASIEVVNLEMDEMIYYFTTGIKGAAEEISLYHIGSPPKRHLSYVVQGDLLLTLTLKDNELYTKWGVLMPMGQTDVEEGVYFVRE